MSSSRQLPQRRARTFDVKDCRKSCTSYTLVVSFARYIVPFLFAVPYLVERAGGAAAAHFAGDLLDTKAQPKQHSRGYAHGTSDYGHGGEVGAAAAAAEGPTPRKNTPVKRGQHISAAGIFKRRAYVTLLYSQFIHGTRALGQSLRDSGTSADTVVLVTPDVSLEARDTLSKDGWM